MLSVNPLWHKEAVIYQLHLRAFCDANDDGIGDFRGLTTKLDYLQELGVNALWLLPFYPSPLRDDGYDIADYYGIHPMYGTLHDFRTFLREAHDRGLRVITELVLNHTSDEHPWFKRARNAKPGSRWRDWYVWSDTPDRYNDARIIFRDFEPSNWTWDPVAKAYFWHRFYRHQPDLNYDNPEVRQAMLQVMDHWFGMGVDGMRLDAVPYLVEREGTNCENLPETHGFLKELRAHVDARFQGRMLLAEANQWPEDAVSYFGAGDECHAAFHFPLMPRLFIAVQMEDRFPIVDTLAQTPPIPENCQWMLFLRNHDELTLEMVTEEERDYMYRVYARDPRARVNLGIRRRLAPLMGNDRRKIELLNALLLSLPGAPIIYYGDELGMGDNIYLGDRNGVRTPMQWNANRNAGFSNTGPQQLYLPVVVDYEYHFETVNVETQQNNPNSLLSWMKRLIALRHGSLPLGQGTIEMLYPSNPKILAFIRRSGEQRVLVAANLSRFPQFTELDLSSLEGQVPVEMFGQAEFPPVGKLPYMLTFGSHAFYWFALCSAAPLRVPGANGCPMRESGKEAQLTTLAVHGTWDDVFEGPPRRNLEALFPAFLRSRRWFGGKARTIRSTEVWDVLFMRPRQAVTSREQGAGSNEQGLHNGASRSPPGHGVPAQRVGSGSAPSPTSVGMVLLRVEYTDAEPEGYLIPVAFGDESQLRATNATGAAAIICRLEVEQGGGRTTGVLYDAFGDEGLSRFLLDMTASRRSYRGKKGTLSGRPSRAFRRMRQQNHDPLKIAVSKAEQSNSTVFYGERYLLKLFRRLEEGTNPELEIESFLTDNLAFPHAPPLAGAIEYTRSHSQTDHSYRAVPARAVTIGVLEGFVHNQGDAWSYTLEVVERYFEKVLSQQPLPEVPAEAIPKVALVQLLDAEPPALAESMFGPYLQSAALLGRRTAELHVALASETDVPHFGQEPFSQLYQRSLYQAVRNLAARTFTMLRGSLKRVSDEVGAGPGRHVAGKPDLRAAQTDREAKDRRHPHPLPWRLPLGPGPLHRQRLRNCRFRGRADPVHHGTPAPGIALPRRGRHVAVVRLRLLFGAY